MTPSSQHLDLNTRVERLAERVRALAQAVGLPTWEGQLTALQGEARLFLAAVEDLVEREVGPHGV